MTRSTQTRNAEKRPVVYTPPSDLDFPEEVLEYYHSKGYRLRWVRFSTAGEFDDRNIARYKREGWQFVNKTELGEISEELKGFFDTTKIGTNNSVICQGDLVLAKIETELLNARQKYYEQMSTDAVESTRREARQTDGHKQIDKYTPLTDEEYETTYTT